MSYFKYEITSIGIFSVASLILAIVLLLVVYIISFTSKVEIEKSSAYECGFQPFSETSYPFEVQFAIIAIMFLLFDIEVLYLFPLCTSLFSLNTLHLTYLILFFGILTLGIVFEISRNVLKFTSRTNTVNFSEKAQPLKDVLGFASGSGSASFSLALQTVSCLLLFSILTINNFLTHLMLFYKNSFLNIIEGTMLTFILFIIIGYNISITFLTQKRILIKLSILQKFKLRVKTLSRWSWSHKLLYYKGGLINPFAAYVVTPNDPQAVAVFTLACDETKQLIMEGNSFSQIQEILANEYHWAISSTAIHRMGNLLLESNFIKESFLIKLTDIGSDSIFYTLNALGSPIHPPMTVSPSSLPLNLEVASESYTLWWAVLGVSLLIISFGIGYLVYKKKFHGDSDIPGENPKELYLVNKSDEAGGSTINVPDLPLSSAYEPLVWIPSNYILFILITAVVLGIYISFYFKLFPMHINKIITILIRFSSPLTSSFIFGRELIIQRLKSLITHKLPIYHNPISIALIVCHLPTQADRIKVYTPYQYYYKIRFKAPYDKDL